MKLAKLDNDEKMCYNYNVRVKPQKILKLFVKKFTIYNKGERKNEKIIFKRWSY